MDQSPGRGSKILYLTYDGLADPVCRSQVLPYLVRLSAAGHRITVLSCEKPAALRRDRAEIEAICAAAKIDWRPLRYHKWPPILSGAWDAELLKRAAVRLHKTVGFDVVHCRSYLPAGVGLALKRRFGVSFLFDMRGLWPDERMETGSWPRSHPLYRLVYARVKRLESRLLKGADHIICLTNAVEARLREMPGTGSTPISVIPCCADFDHFPLISEATRAAGRQALDIPADANVLAYLGSIASWYMLEEVMEFFTVYLARNPSAILLFVTQAPEATILTAAAAQGIDPDRIRVRAASRNEVPRLMAAADVGIFFVRPIPSSASRSPVKMGEMMALGLPIVTNAGISDVQEIVEESRCGVVIRGLAEASFHEAVSDLERLRTSPAEIRARGRLWYDLDEGSRRYDGIYRALSGRSGSGSGSYPDIVAEASGIS